MDRYKIAFKCLKEPNGQAGLQGYTLDQQYTGRTFNGLFEVSPNWGSGDNTKLIEKKIFFQYFDLVRQN